MRVTLRQQILIAIIKLISVLDFSYAINQGDLEIRLVMQNKIK